MTSDTPPEDDRAPDGRWRTRYVVVAVVVVALAAGLAGVVIGRATKTATAPDTGLSPSWQALPQAPIAGRVYEGVVWTGTEMIVWGGGSGPTGRVQPRDPLLAQDRPAAPGCAR